MDNHFPFNSSMISRNIAFSYLESLKSLFSDLTVEKTEHSPLYSFDSSVKAVLFDIYGTLLISEAGDIGLTSLDEGGSSRSFQMDLERESKEISFSEIKSILSGLVYSHHTRIRNSSSAIDYPEVDIIVLWNEVFQKLGIKDYGIVDLIRNSLKFEILSNKVSLMPGLHSLFRFLKRQNLPLGIVSNAQFYTPLIVEFLSGMTLRELGFRRKFSAWSFELERGKPDIGIFAPPLKSLNETGISNHEVLYVGNDMLNDIATAASFGMKTALFAGDKRSLRLRENDPRVAGVSPDFVITELNQLKYILEEGSDG